MKIRLFLMAAMVATLGFLTGCGNDVDENKTPETIKAEVEKLDFDKIESIVDAYGKVIEEKADELEDTLEKLKEIPLKDQLGDEARKLQTRAAELGRSLDKLKANLAAYMEGLKNKAK